MMAHGTGYWVDKQSEPWNEVLYSLQLALPVDLDVSDLAVWKINNDPSHHEASSKLTIECWVNADGLSGSNSLFDICSRGFAVEEDEPLELTHGAIEAVTESGMMQYVLCHVKVGRSLVLEETKQLKGKHLPEGYDSFYVSTDAGRGGLYAVTDASAVTAKYVARFTVGLGCDDSEDDGTKDAYDRPDFFDPTAICAVSVRDKMTGPYSTGELATHKLVPLNEAYDMALTEARSDSVVESRLAAIEHGLASVDAAMRRVNLNFAQVEERIYSLLQDALYDLQRRAGDRLSAILAIEVELRRRRAELLSARERLARVASKSTPSSSSQHLIWAWAAQRKQHSVPMQLDDILAPLRALPAELDVLGAVRVVDGGGRFAKACSQRSYDGEEALKLRSALKDGLAGLSEPEPRQRTSPGRTEEKTVLKHRHEALSLRSMMNRKTRQLHCKLDPQQMFYTSRLVFGEDASALYATLPFAEHPPNTHLVYSSEAQPKTVAAINAELTKSNSNSSLFVAKAGDFCFGAYASDPWRCDGDLFGSPMAFLFSLTLDVKVPYHGATPPQNTIKRHACIRATNDYISFGDGDLVIKGQDLSDCSSDLEHLFGLGLIPGCEEATTLLAGSSKFKRVSLVASCPENVSATIGSTISKFGASQHRPCATSRNGGVSDAAWMALLR